jgi:hypothetical protein
MLTTVKTLIVFNTLRALNNFPAFKTVPALKTRAPFKTLAPFKTVLAIETLNDKVGRSRDETRKYISVSNKKGKPRELGLYQSA